MWLVAPFMLMSGILRWCDTEKNDSITTQTSISVSTEESSSLCWGWLLGTLDIEVSPLYFKLPTSMPEGEL